MHVARLRLYTQLFELMAPRFEELFPIEPAAVMSPSFFADEETRWRVVADLSSHASPAQLGTIPRSARLWELVEGARAHTPPAHYFASLVAASSPPPP